MGIRRPADQIYGTTPVTKSGRILAWFVTFDSNASGCQMITWEDPDGSLQVREIPNPADPTEHYQFTDGSPAVIPQINM